MKNHTIPILIIREIQKWYKIYKEFLDISSNGAFSEVNSSRKIDNSRKPIKSSTNSDSYIWVGYDVWGNEEDGFEVNNVYPYRDNKIIINDDADDNEILKILCAEGIFNRKYIDRITIDWSSSDGGFIEFEDDISMPLGRLEKVDGVYNSRKAIKSSITQRELKDMIRTGQAIDITYDEDSLPEGVRLDVLQISKGTYGMNGALFKGSDGNLYAIAGRTSNLFRWV